MLRTRWNPRRRQFTVTLTLPRFRSIARWRQRWARWLRRHQQQLNHALTVSLLVGGAAGLLYSLAPLLAPPPTPTPVTRQLAASTALAEPAAPEPATLPRSVPTRLHIPAINLTTDLITTGKNPDGTLAVPERYDVAAWYELSPTPGELGPAVIVGHVDNYLGPAVFYSLRHLQPGQSIAITRHDGRTATFTVERVALFDQATFPTAEVYGNIDHAGLRLITCGGRFNPLTGAYEQNTVVYASLRDEATL